MKKQNLSRFFIAVFLAAMNMYSVRAQTDKKSLLVDVSYHVDNNSYPYITVFTKTKVGKQFLPVKEIKAKIFISDTIESDLLGQVITNTDGKAFVAIPAAMKNIWDSSASVSFKAITSANASFDDGEGETTITKTKIEIDTTSDETAKSIIVKVKELNGKDWVPSKDVEM